MVYSPNGDSNDEGKIEILIAGLKNPFNCTFNIASCGDVGRYLTVSTGYRKSYGELPPGISSFSVSPSFLFGGDMPGKIGVWVALRCMVEKDINEKSASHLKSIWSEWKDNVPVGIFFTAEWSGNASLYNYCITSSMDEISSLNLYEHNMKSKDSTSKYAYDYTDSSSESNRMMEGLSHPSMAKESPTTLAMMKKLPMMKKLRIAF